jgi:LacI family transcriptional regulator
VVGSGASARLFGVGRARLEAFRSGLGGLGLPLPPEHLLLSDIECSEQVATELTTALLKLPVPPTALIAGTDSLAIGALRAVRAAGLTVPNDLALVCFDEPLYADLIDPPITSLDRHDRELGASAALLLLRRLSVAASERIDGEGWPESITETAFGVTRVALALRPRRSCGCI